MTSKKQEGRGKALLVLTLTVALLYAVCCVLAISHIAANTPDTTPLQKLGAALYVLLITAGLFSYLLLFAREMCWNPKSMLLFGIVTMLAVLLTPVYAMLYARITPILIAVLLTALLVDRRAALANAVFLSFYSAMILGGGDALFSAQRLTFAVSSLAGGAAAVLALYQGHKRSAAMTAGFIGGLFMALSTAAAYMLQKQSVFQTLIDCGWAVGSGVISAIIVVGTLSFWENMFDIATTARLNELSNANHPLLRQLMKDAPGTYHHSMMTGALAEGAAEDVGADPLLCRVGAYYHDVGKLRRPSYFKENQKPGENIHDTLPPLERAGYIIAHQKDSVALLTKYKLPAAIRTIAYEHHGNSMAAYFYRKAVQLAGDKPVSQKPYRYPGARPSTKESAIVLLSDSCEAAVRSLQEPTTEDIREMVHKIVRGKMDDGQLSAAPLTLSQISQIEESFVRTLCGINHERIEYPEAREEAVRP